MPGSRSPLPLLSSWATMNRDRDFSFSAEKYDAIDLARRGLNRRIASSSAAEATSNHRHGFGTVRFQVVNRSEHIVLKGGVIEIRLAGTSRAAESTEIDCEGSKSFRRQSLGLLSPALLVESAAVSEHNAAGALAIEIGANPATVFGGERDGSLCGPQGSKDEGEERGAKD